MPQACPSSSWSSRNGSPSTHATRTGSLWRGHMPARPFGSPSSCKTTRSRRTRSGHWPSFGSTRGSQIRSISPSGQSPWPSALATSRRSNDAKVIYGHCPRLGGPARRGPRDPLRVTAVGRARRNRDRRPSLLSLHRRRACRPVGARACSRRAKYENAHTGRAVRSLRTHLPYSCRSRGWRRSRGT